MEEPNLTPHFIHVGDIIIPPNRDRKDFKEDELATLAQSIQKVGLLHLPVVRLNTDDGTYILVVGERRLRAMKNLHAEGKTFTCLGYTVPLYDIPVHFYDELDEDRAKEVELEENLRRVDLTWQERTKAIDALHTALGGNAATTAAYLSTHYNTTINPTRVTTSKLLAQYMNHHEVNSARTEGDAIKQMYKVMQRQVDLHLGATAKPKCDFRLGDYFDEMKKIPDGSIDVVCTDPPYGIDADKSDIHQFQGQVHTYKDSWKEVQDMLYFLADLSYRKTKPQAHLYLFCDITRFWHIKTSFEMFQWNVWSRPIIWMKDLGIVPALDYGPRRMYETILFANKGQKMVTGVFNDIVQFSVAPNKVHGAQKPTALVKNLLQRSCRAGDVVLDPFCGSGTIFIAGNELKLVTIGIDNDPAMAAIIEKRLKDGK